MAAWSDHEDGPWVETRSKYMEGCGGEFRDKGRPSEVIGRIGHSKNLTVSTPENPAKTSEPFPIEVWTFFSDSDLDQLVVDACAEMGRRELGRNQWVMGADAARAVGRFKPNGPDGYRAATAPDAPLRATRAEAVEDERVWLERGAK